VPAPTPTPTPVLIPPKIKIPPPPPALIGLRAEIVGEKARLPFGSIAFKQGAFWKYIPPPYDQPKPITLPRGITPIGADTSGGNSPYTTVQKIGESDAIVPENIAIDKGVVDAFISKQGSQIRFAGEGERTNVGTRIDSPTMGMSIGEVENTEIDETVRQFNGPVRQRHPVVLKRKPKRASKRLSEQDYMTTLKGFRF